MWTRVEVDCGATLTDHHLQEVKVDHSDGSRGEGHFTSVLFPPNHDTISP